MVAGIKSVGGVGGAWSGIGLNGKGVGVIEFTVIFAIGRREGGIVVYHGHIHWRIYNRVFLYHPLVGRISSIAANGARSGALEVCTGSPHGGISCSIKP